MRKSKINRESIIVTYREKIMLEFERCVSFSADVTLDFIDIFKSLIADFKAAEIGTDDTGEIHDCLLRVIDESQRLRPQLLINGAVVDPGLVGEVHYFEAKIALEFYCERYIREKFLLRLKDKPPSEKMEFVAFHLARISRFSLTHGKEIIPKALNRIREDLENDGFIDVIQKMKEFSDDVDKISFLITEVTRWKQNVPSWNNPPDSGVSFVEKCQLELRKYELFNRIGDAVDSEGFHSAGATANSPQKRGLNKHLAILLMEELIPQFSETSNSSKAEFLAFLTGFSPEALRIKWSDYNRDGAMKKNKKIVDDWKKKLGLDA